MLGGWISVPRSEETPCVDISATVVVMWPSTANQELRCTGQTQLFIPIITWVFFMYYRTMQHQETSIHPHLFINTSSFTFQRGCLVV